MNSGAGWIVAIVMGVAGIVVVFGTPRARRLHDGG